MTMTWAEFKKFVEKEMKEKKISSNVTIDYFDFSWANVNEIELFYDQEDNSIAIS